MKAKIILPVVVVIFLVALFIANRIYGNKIANEIDFQLKSKIEKNEFPASIVYSEVNVNPLFSKVQIVGVSVSDTKENVSFKCNELNIDIPYKEALRLAESNEFEEMYSVKLNFVQPKIEYADSKILVEMNDLIVDFDGHLTSADFENIQTTFPAEKQNLEFSFTKLKLNMPAANVGRPPLSELQKQFTEFDKGSYSLAFNPETKELNVKQFAIESPVVSYKGNTVFTYDGNGLNDFKPKTAELESDLLFQPKDIDWEDEKGGKGEFSLAKLSFKTNSHIAFENQIFPEGEMKLNIEKLKINFDDKKSGNGGGLFNLSMNNIEMDKLELNYLLSAEKLSITDSKIKSSLIDATVFADVNMDRSNPANSNINEAQIKVKSLSADLEKMLSGFERQMGKELPREDGVIVLELTGKLARPTIKGFEF
jgi:hypothetical protein